jgi:hypothetical protein
VATSNPAFVENAPRTTAVHKVSEEVAVSQASKGSMANDEWNCALAHKADGNSGATSTENKHHPPDEDRKAARRDAQNRSFPSAFPVAGRAHVHAEWRRAAA